MSHSLKYRAEIDGLRAIAVVAVVLFHIDPSWLPGGFLGVDVFFVISGYLITTIIQRALDSDKFALGGFWGRRIKRLYPALFVMVAVVALFGNYILINPERGELFTQTIGAIFSFSNILLWQTTGGYWDNSSENIALLHTWSLSLEEQFYIVFPPLLMLIHKVAKKHVLLLTFAILCVSLALSAYATTGHRNGAFYLLPTRMWELTIGSLLAIIQLRGMMPKIGNQFAAPLGSLGIAMVLLSFFVIENNENFPGVFPLLPCLGTALILAFSNAKGISKRLLSLGLVVYIGRISYSLYLWHWPVIVFGRFLSPADNTLILLALPVVFASLSYHFIENPFRAGFKGSSKVIGAMPVVVAICLLPIVFIANSPGVPAELADIEADEQLTRARKFEATPSLKKGPSGVTIGAKSSTPDIIIVGSSHARVLTPPIANFVEATNRSLEIFATSGLGIANITPSPEKKYAGTIYQNRTTRLRELHAKVSIVADMWTSQTRLENFEAELTNLLTLLSSHSDQVLVVSQVPKVPLPAGYRKAFNKYILATTRAGNPSTIPPDKRVPDSNAAVKGIVDKLNLGNVHFINVYDKMIAGDDNIKMFEKGKIIYFDSHHVNHNGAEYLFEEVLREHLETALK